MIKIPQGMLSLESMEFDENQKPVHLSILRVNAVTVGKIYDSKRMVELYPDALNKLDVRPVVNTFLRQFYYELYDHKELGLILGCIDTGHVITMKENISFRY